jgi:hypothetical protein
MGLLGSDSELRLLSATWTNDYTANIYSPVLVILLCKSIKVIWKMYNLMIDLGM